MTDLQETDPLAAARALIEQDEQDRMGVCRDEIESVLARHGMRLTITPAQITITPA